MEDYISIKEFASKAGVSTQAIYQRIEKDLKGFVKVENGKKLILIAALEFFKYKKENQVDYQETENCLQKNDNKTKKNSSDFKDILEFLQSQLVKKDEQLAEKDKQIAEKDRQLSEKDKQLKDLTSALIIEQQSAQQAQALHAGTIKQTALIESDTRKNSFWTRLFRRSEKK